MPTAGDDPTTQATLNIPSILAFAVISILAVRYFFFSPSPASSSSASSASAYPASSNSSSSTARRRVPPDRIETLTAMFPQLAARDVEYDLLRNGASVQATTERVLRDGRLPAAPPNFQPQSSPSSPPSRPAVAAAAPRANQQPQHADLITRYNLSARLRPAPASGAAAEEPMQLASKQKEKGGWSGNKTERQALLQRRREEMVLAARRKMEERVRAEKGAGS